MTPRKLIAIAVRLVMKGAWDEAIEQQHRVLEADPKNLRALQKLAELYRKRDDPLVAAYYLSQAADRYVSHGYLIQAAALYKQVLELDPRLPDTQLRLAELYQRLGVKSEALAYYRIVAHHYDTLGDVPNARGILQTMLALDPGNGTLTHKLAELAARQDPASPEAHRTPREGGPGDPKSP